MMAFSGILFGRLADKYSRAKLLACVEMTFGIGFFLNGFVADSLGNITFILFWMCSLIRSFSIGGFWPIISSYINDSIEKDGHSQFFGLLNALFQVFQTIGMLFSSFLFQSYLWRSYFLVIGILYMIFSFVMLLKAKEPKRGSARGELKESLSNDDISYEYKLTKETIKSTIFAPTNIIAFFEGIFTSLVIAIPDFLLIAYLQSSPYNFAPFTTAIFMIIFGLPGGFIGAIVFAKLSDRLAKRTIKNRVYMIVFSMVTLFILFIVFFNFPLPSLTVDEGKNILIFLSFPIMWIMGVLVFIVRSVISLWNINQPPILQEINLPEAQGTISSVNQFLEAIGGGTGPIIAGAVLLTFNSNYQLTAGLTLGIGIIGGAMWLLSVFWIDNDVKRVSSILKQRGKELNGSVKKLNK
jgi:MFS family permease